MKIKHNDMDESYPIPLRSWQTGYLSSGKYRNYTITDYHGIYELWKVDERTGELKFNMLIDSNSGKNLVRKEPRRFKLNPLGFQHYDRNLILRDVVKWNMKRMQDALSFGTKKNDPLKNDSWFKRNFDGLSVGVVSGIVSGIIIIIIGIILISNGINY
ncbi:hypothetical protein [[Muricauda] lutisoli]|uniref:NUMOD4 domain-containing protein n=1 Tax=[Muricauda] lutisoli TaxID=2816035 RepID=A0ABS3EUC3_9FLAO|nr:hypothetical protein [[Muricauda] lutisoli]MBO0329755.1 hypothetical protein [[Muricauda] lutisoli]